MLKIREAIVVEGRYDKNKLSQMVDAVIVETSGFAVFKDGERLSLLRALAEKRGIIVLTDADGAGFVIRNYLRGAIPAGQVKHAYIPDIYGKERRKRAPGKEGKLAWRECALRCWRRLCAGRVRRLRIRNRVKHRASGPDAPSPRRTFFWPGSPAGPTPPPGGRRC